MLATVRRKTSSRRALSVEMSCRRLSTDSPTSVSSSPKWTMDGVFGWPSALSMTSASPVRGSSQATLELVVPKSMPMEGTYSLMAHNLQRGSSCPRRRRGLWLGSARFARERPADIIPHGEPLSRFFRPDLALPMAELHGLLEA